MLEHLKLLVLLIILFSGFWLIFYLKQVHKSYPDKSIKAIIIYNLWYIIISSLQFLSLYIKSNLDVAERDSYMACIKFSINFGFLFSLYLILNILLSFRAKSFKRSTNKWLLIIAGFIIISYIIKLFIPETQSLFFWIEYIDSNEYLLFKLSEFFELSILFGFYLIWGKSKINISRIKISKAFIIIYTLAHLIPIIIFNHLLIPYIYQQINTWFIIFFLKITFFLIIFLWTKFIFLDYAQKIPNVIKKNNKFKPIYAKYKISKRETEIIEFLIDGKTSNEIKDELFISYHTVKNHISHIYEKLNVKTRYELIKFFEKFNNI